MAHVKNTTGNDLRFPNGPRVNVGEVVEVDDDTAASLVEQGWKVATKKEAADAERAAKTEAEPPADDTGTDGASDKEKP